MSATCPEVCITAFQRVSEAAPDQRGQQGVACGEKGCREGREQEPYTDDQPEADAADATPRRTAGR